MLVNHHLAVQMQFAKQTVTHRLVLAYRSL